MNIFSSLLAICLLAGVAQAEAYDAITSYKQETIHGFQILINSEVLQHEAYAAKMRKELTSQLAAIIKVLPDEHLAELRKVTIWVEWQAKEKGAAEFHPSEKWLVDNGYNPRKTRAIELCNTVNFVNWSRSAQPWMVMHEMAHAYHFRVLGEDNRDVATAFKQAKKSQTYDSVKHVNGEKQRAYAMKNNKEYFAEITEAYLGKNDFYPFTCEELKQHDPVGYQLMQDCWSPASKNVEQ